MVRPSSAPRGCGCAGGAGRGDSSVTRRRSPKHGGAGGREDGSALTLLTGRAPLPLTHGGRGAPWGGLCCGLLCAWGEGSGPFGFLLLGARRGPQSLPIPPGGVAAVTGGRVHCHPEPEPPFGGASPGPLSVGRSSAMGASLLLGKVKPSGGPADPRGGALCVPPTACGRSRGTPGGSERSSHPRGDGRRGRRAFRGAHRSGRAVGPMAVADTRCAPAVGGGVSGTALGVGAPLGSGALDPSEFPPGKSAAPRERLRAAPTGGGRRKWGWEGNKGNAAGRRRGAEPGSGCRSPNVGQWGNAPPAPTPAPSAAFVWRCPPAPLPAPLVCGGRIASHGIARGRGHTHPVRGDAGRCGGTLTSPLPPGTNKAPIVCGAASCRVLRCGVGFFSFAFSFLTQLSSNSQRRRTAVSAPSFSCRVGSFLSCLFSLSSFPPPPSS